MLRPMHFEIMAADPERAAKFYTDVFGWKFQKWEGPMEYWLIMTGDRSQPGIDGGMMKGDTPMTINTVPVPNIDEYIEKVTAAGGKIHKAKHEIPGVGYHGYVEDTEGNVFGVLQPANEKMEGAEFESTHKTPRPVHFEITVADPDRAAKFYTDVFGWKFQKWEGPMEYWMVITGDKDDPHGINGGMMKGDAPKTANTIAIPNIDEFVDKVIAAGGKVIMPKDEIPTVGMFAYVADTEGNEFGILQPSEEMMRAAA